MSISVLAWGKSTRLRVRDEVGFVLSVARRLVCSTGTRNAEVLQKNRLDLLASRDAILFLQSSIIRYIFYDVKQRRGKYYEMFLSFNFNGQSYICTYSGHMRVRVTCPMGIPSQGKYVQSLL